MPIGSIIGAIGSLAGGLIGKSSADKAREAQAQQAAQNIALQKEFAQSGIQWRVNDAKAAGIHPLYALGAQTHSFSPVSIDGGADMSMANAVSSMGQDIGRAVNATRSQPARDAALQLTMLQMEGLKLDNDMKRTQIASQIQRLRVNANPALPIPEQAPEARPIMYLGGNRWMTDPGTSNAEDAEKRYSDVGGAMFAPYVLWRDYKANYGAYPFSAQLWPPRAQGDLNWLRASVTGTNRSRRPHWYSPSRHYQR